jgi:hypothetical protein
MNRIDKALVAVAAGAIALVVGVQWERELRLRRAGNGEAHFEASPFPSIRPTLVPEARAARNGGGTFSLYTPGNPVVTQTPITVTWANNTLNDIATEITDSLDRSGKGGMLAPLGLTTGSAGAPSLTFNSATTTGLYLNGTGVRVSVTATDSFKFDPAVNTSILLFQLGNNGAVTTPSLSWTSEPNSGPYRNGANDIRWAIAGADVLKFSTAAVAPLALTPFSATRGVPFVGVATPASPSNGDLWYDTTTLRFGGQVNGITAGVWQTLSLGSGWTAGAPAPAVTKQLDGTVRYRGNATWATGGSSTPFTAAAGYRPGAQFYAIFPDNSTGTAANATVNTGGVWTVQSALTNTHAYYFDNVTYLGEN